MTDIDFSLAVHRIANVPWVLKNKLMALAGALLPISRTNIISVLSEAEQKEYDILQQGCTAIDKLERQAKAASHQSSAHVHA